jgi:hypothetical protein
MNATIERPSFYEQQILAATDLDAQVTYARNALARHERSQHIWGVVEGLSLTKTDNGFTVSPGIAVDVTGRQIVVEDEYLFNNQNFIDAGVQTLSDPPDQWYPVFIDGVDEVQSAPPFNPGQCSVSGSSRVTENFDITVGRPGAELTDPTNPAPGDGPSGAPGVASWPVLIGYVQWDRTGSGAISKAQAQVDATRSARYSGIRADTIAARGGSITLRTQPLPQGGKPALSLNESGGGTVQFGLLKADGSLNPLMWVNASGDLQVVGKIKGALAAGAVVAESGFASDGVTIALPAGVTDQQVLNQEAQVHVIVSPLVDPSAAPDTNSRWIASSLECYVDDTRQVHCRTRWLQLDFGNAPPTPRIEDVAATCSYLIVASIKQK